MCVCAVCNVYSKCTYMYDLKPKLFHFSFLKSLHKKTCFFELLGAYLEGDAVGSTKGCARACYYKMQCA